MYRLVRKFRARVKTRELAALGVALAVAVVSARGAGLWYRSSGYSAGFVVSVNTLGGSGYAIPSEQRQMDGADKSIRYDSITGTPADASAEPRNLLAHPADGYSAAYVSMPGDSPDGGGWARDIETAYPTNPEEQHYSPDDAQSQIPPQARYGSAEINNDGGAESADAAAAGSTTAAGMDGGIDANSGESPANAVFEGPAYTVKVIVDDQRHVFETPGMKVADLFARKGIAVSENDRVYGAYLESTIDSDLYIEIKRVKIKSVTEDVKIPAKVVYRENSAMEKGATNVVRAGSDGLKRVEYELVYENGVQVDKRPVKEEILTEAVSKVVEQGSIGSRVDSVGNTFSYAKVIDVKCTAYSSAYESTGKRPGDPAYGVTASGTTAKKGVVAVDPSVIPLGTRLYIDILDESVDDYGYAVAEDTGGKIKGKKVDLYFDLSYEELRQFGVHKAKVYILN